MINQADKTFYRKIYNIAYKKRLPIEVLFELTYRCNFRCVHCYNSQEQKKMKSKEELTTKQVFNILRQLKDLGCLFLSFTGGEIFLREDILDILRYARQLGFEIKLLTNASLIDERIADELKKIRINRIDITVHAIKKDIFEEITRIPHSGDNVFKAIELLHKRDIPLTFKTCGMIANKSEIIKIDKFAKKLGAIYYFSCELMLRGDRTKDPPQYLLKPKERYQLYSKSALKRLIPKGIQALGKMQIKKRNLNKVFTCGVGFTKTAINPRGELKLCAVIDTPKHNILKSSLAECWRRLKDFTDNITPPKDWICKECNLADYCLWCPARGYLEKGSFLACSSFMREEAKFNKQALIKKFRDIIQAAAISR